MLQNQEFTAYLIIYIITLFCNKSNTKFQILKIIIKKLSNYDCFFYNSFKKVIAFTKKTIRSFEASEYLILSDSFVIVFDIGHAATSFSSVNSSLSLCIKIKEKNNDCDYNKYLIGDNFNNKVY